MTDEPDTSDIPEVPDSFFGTATLRPGRLTQAELEALRQSVGHATLADIGAELKEGVKAEHVKAIGDYLHHFAARKRTADGELHPRNPCLRCNGALHGTLMDQLLSGHEGFEWGLVHGSGHCRNCGWPATLYHRIRDAEGEILIEHRGTVLQAHPDEIEIKE